MKQVKSVEMEVGKVVGELTKGYLEKGLVLTRFETGGINSFTKIMVFSSTETTAKEVIFVRTHDSYRWYEEGIRTHRVYTSTLSEDKAGTGFIDSMFEEADKEEVAEFILFANRGKQFVMSQEEHEAMVAKRKERSRNSYIAKYAHQFKVEKLKSVKGFKRQSATVTRLSGTKLIYEVVGSEKGSKRVSL